MPHAYKFTLGRQQQTKRKQFSSELINPVSEMLKYISPEADLKNDYHLADKATNIYFVNRSKNIFKQFEDGTKQYLNKKSEKDTTNDLQKQVKEDFNNFCTRFRLRNLTSKNQHTLKN